MRVRMDQKNERAHSFDMREQNNFAIQKKVENFLQKYLMLSTDTTRLGKSLVRINYYNENVEKELQKDNRITILHENDKTIYIQVSGKLTDTQIGELWNELEKYLKIIKNQEVIAEKISNKNEIVNLIVTSIKKRGYTVENIDAQNFVDNFQEKYNRLPKDEELDSIVKGYIIMKNEEYILEKEKTSKKEVISEDEKLTFKESSEKVNLTIDQNGVLVISPLTGRRKCPSCENEGLIHEIVDKSIILLDYPRIYGKKYRCGTCGQEWREK